MAKQGEENAGCKEEGVREFRFLPNDPLKVVMIRLNMLI